MTLVEQLFERHFASKLYFIHLIKKYLSIPRNLEKNSTLENIAN